MPAPAPAPRRGLLVAIALAAVVVIAEVSWLAWSMRVQTAPLTPTAATAEAPPPVVPPAAGTFDLVAELDAIDARYVLAPDRRFVAAGALLRTWTGAEPVPVPDGDFEARLAALRTQAAPVPARSPARGLRDASPLDRPERSSSLIYPLLGLDLGAHAFVSPDVSLDGSVSLDHRWETMRDTTPAPVVPGGADLQDDAGHQAFGRRYNASIVLAVSRWF